MKKILFMLFISLFISNLYSFEENEVMRGMIYRQDSIEPDLLYVQKEFRSGDLSSEEISHRYFGSDNEMEAFETVTLENGKIDFYETAINGLGFSGTLQFENKRIKITRIMNGKTKTKSLRMRNDLIVGPMLPSFVQENLQVLSEGDVVHFHLPFFERMTLIPMILVRKKGLERETDSTMIIEMKLKSRLLNFFIDPVEMTVDMNKGKIIEIHGPTILPDPGGEKSKKHVDADIYYEYRGI